jgi:hypothetical protein
MDCEKYEVLFTDWINKDLPPDELLKLEQHLTGCKSCSEELAAMKALWMEMGEMDVPAPSAHMQVKFQAMLNTYKADVAERNSTWAGTVEKLRSLWKWQPRVPMAYNLVVILISFACGYWVFSIGKGGKQDEQLEDLTTQVHELKQTMMLSMLENPSASERIKGVSYTSEIKHVDEQVIDALLATLNNDPNVNVRLITLDALSRLADHAEVRSGLIQSITEQESPLMQSAIADVMLSLQERRSVGSFKELLKQKNLDNGVRTKINKTINSLI